MKKGNIFIILTFLLVFQPALISFQDKTGSISGFIVNEREKPVKRCSITLEAAGVNLKAEANSKNGKFTFSSLEPRNDYILTFRSNQYQILVKQNIRVRKGKKTHLKVRLKKALGNIPGRWRLSREQQNPAGVVNAEDKKLTAEQKAAMRRLESLGYLPGTRKASKQKNITRYSENESYKGLNLYCSGHDPEAILMDMKGRLLHKWRCEMKKVWPDYELDSYGYQFWRHVHLFENGDLLAIFDGYGLIKLDKDSRLLWAYKGRAHHDLFVAADNKIYVLTRKAVMNPKYAKNKPILEDFITILNPAGKEIGQLSVLKALEKANYPVKEKMESVDILHTNTIELLDGSLAQRLPAFKKGNILLSCCYFNLVCVVDFKAQQIVWTLSDMWKLQHLPTVLDNGNILIFDNRGGRGEQSRVLEFDPGTKKIHWLYEGTPAEPFFTAKCGYNQRLPNGNTLITESDNGRAFEVTPGKKIVWEFFNPHRAGKYNELIATLFELIRLEADFPLDWLSNRK